MLELAVFEQCSKIVRRLTTKGLSQSKQRIHGNTAKYFWILKFWARFGSGYGGYPIIKQKVCERD